MNTLGVILASALSTILQDVWSPLTGEVLPLKRKPDNLGDVHAVAIKRASRIVRHVPFNLTPTISAFLRRSRYKC